MSAPLRVVESLPEGMALARLLFCCAPVGSLGVPCMRSRSHRGGCLPLPERTPRAVRQR